MKKFFCTVLLFFPFLLLNADGYQYGFILSCGSTEYHVFDHPLSDDELIFWSEYFEYYLCGNGELPDKPVPHF